jgi:hypothetical protein
LLARAHRNGRPSLKYRVQPKQRHTPRPPQPEKSKASSSFSKKRTKKLLTPLSRRSGESRDSRIKAFCFFFSKKKDFLASDNQN